MSKADKYKSFTLLFLIVSFMMESSGFNSVPVSCSYSYNELYRRFSHIMTEFIVRVITEPTQTVSSGNSIGAQLYSHKVLPLVVGLVKYATACTIRYMKNGRSELLKDSPYITIYEQDIMLLLTIGYNCHNSHSRSSPNL